MSVGLLHIIVSILNIEQEPLDFMVYNIIYNNQNQILQTNTGYFKQHLFTQGNKWVRPPLLQSSSTSQIGGEVFSKSNIDFKSKFIHDFRLQNLCKYDHY